MEQSNPQKKLLLLGGSHAEIPLIQAAHELGWYVITRETTAMDSVTLTPTRPFLQTSATKTLC